MVAIGERFIVLETHEVRDKNNSLLARYRTDFDYRVTARNLPIVAALIAEGKAKIGTRADVGRAALAAAEAERASRPKKKRGVVVKSPALTGRVKGVVNTGPAPKQET